MSSATHQPAITRRVLAVAIAVSLSAATSPAWAEEPETADKVDLDTISVTASRIERTTREVPAAIAVVDEKRIDQAQMMNVKDAIQGTPGVLIDSKNGGYDVRLVIRGAGQKANYGVREIMVIRDGVPMTDPDSFSRFDYIDTQDIERIEISKGPGNLYSSGAAGGTLQIISKSVFDTSNRVKLGLGTEGAESYHVRYGADINDSNAFSVTASRRVMDNDWRNWNQFDTNQVSFKHGLMLDGGGLWESELSYSEADIQLPGSLDKALFDEYKRTGEVDDTQDPWKHSGRYSKIWFFNSRLEQSWGDLTFKPRVYFNRWEHYHPVTGAINDNPGTNVFGTDLEFNWNHRLIGDSTLVAGVTYRVDDTDEARKYKYADVITGYGGRITSTLSDRAGDLMETEEAHNTLYGIYLQESVQPAERWLVDAGFRLDRSKFDIHTDQIWSYDYGSSTYVYDPQSFDTEKTFNLFSPRLGVTYRLTDTLNLFASLAQADQIPAESELQKNTALDASTARNLEVGIKGRSDNWSFDLSVYQTKVSDEIVSVLDTGGDTTFQNAGETDKKGLEFSGRLRLGKRWWAGLGYAYSDYKFEEFSEVISGFTFDRSGNHLPFTPRHQYNFSLEYDHPSGFKARVQADSWSEYYVDNANSDTYKGFDFVTNLMLGYEQGPHALVFTVDNLFDDHYATEVKKSTYFAMGSWQEKYYYYPASPRTAMLTYRYTF